MNPLRMACVSAPAGRCPGLVEIPAKKPDQKVSRDVGAGAHTCDRRPTGCENR